MAFHLLLLGMMVSVAFGCSDDDSPALTDRHFVALTIKDGAIQHDSRLVFTGKDKLAFITPGGISYDGDYWPLSDTSFAFAVGHDGPVTERYTDTCKIKYDKGWCRCKKTRGLIVDTDRYNDVVEGFAPSWLGKLTWKYGHDDQNGWSITLKNNGYLTWENITLCLNGRGCDGRYFKGFELSKGSEHEFRIPGTLNTEGLRLAPGQTMTVPVGLAICHMTGKIFDPDEYGITVLYARGRTRYPNGYVGTTYTALQNSP